MPKTTRKRNAKGRDVVRKAIDKVESKVLTAAGRRALHKKTAAVAEVGKMAAKAGLVVGAAAATGVAVGAIVKSRKG